MRKFKTLSPYQYGEQEVQEQGNGNKRFTLTQKHDLFSEDYYSVSRFIAVKNCSVDVVSEKDFYVVKINYMETGCTLTSIIIDAESFEEILIDNAKDFIEGTMNFNYNILL